MDTCVWLRVAAVSGACVLVLAGTSACDQDSDAGSIAFALADRLTDALDFENGSVQDGVAPDGEVGDPAVPQIVGAGLPARLAPGGGFGVKLLGSFDGDPALVRGAVVQVDGDDRHILVQQPFADYQMLLPGTLNAAATDLIGKTFRLRVALISTSGRAGAYAVWLVKIVAGADRELAACSWMATVSEACGELSYVCADLDPGPGFRCDWDGCAYLDPSGAAQVILEACNAAFSRTWISIDELGNNLPSEVVYDLDGITRCTGCATAAEQGRCTAVEFIESTTEQQWNVISDFVAPECRSQCKDAEGKDRMAALWSAVGGALMPNLPAELATDPACE